MSDSANQNLNPGGAPAVGAPAAGAPAAGAPGASDGGQPSVAQRPEFIPEGLWDSAANGLKPEAAEVFKFHQTETERKAALAARKPEDIKFELKLPDTVKVPDGFEVKIDEKDPRLPFLRDLAVARGLDHDTINDLVALDAQQKIAMHAVETARVAAEDQKLGDNVKVRKGALETWAKGLLDAKTISAEEHEELRMTATTAAGVTLLEKLMAKANGAVPGNSDGNPPPPPKPAAVPIEQRWYPNQQKAG